MGVVREHMSIRVACRVWCAGCGIGLSPGVGMFNGLKLDGSKYSGLRVSGSKDLKVQG